jgi:hypothetical protein
VGDFDSDREHRFSTLRADQAILAKENSDDAKHGSEAW